MSLEERIEEQLKQFRELQRELVKREASVDDAKRPAELRRERARTVRDSLRRLERDRKVTLDRFDREIAARKEELATLEQQSELDVTLRQVGRTGRTTKPVQQSASADADTSETTPHRPPRRKAPKSRSSSRRSSSE